ncbi:hypothetical protein EYF80_029482 [Liparis tanakae]|uniref:Uncharacterized protein n=1 Tax=Liparis tanakae TaxID=230148 RepID=A0A4Z2H382_9TELE|nr:hypothetical protein EYF80_029482 [Liparis tanakae]
MQVMTSSMIWATFTTWPPSFGKRGAQQALAMSTPDPRSTLLAHTCNTKAITGYLNGIGDVPASFPCRDLRFILIQRASRLQGRGPSGGAISLVVTVPVQLPLSRSLHASPFLFSLEDIHLHPLPVVIVQVVALDEAHTFFVGRGLEAQPGEHPADLGLGFVGHRVGRIVGGPFGISLTAPAEERRGERARVRI